MAETRTEWAVRWPDGHVRPKSWGQVVIGAPHRPPLHPCCTWVRRTVTYDDWEDWEPEGGTYEDG